MRTPLFLLIALVGAVCLAGNLACELAPKAVKPKPPQKGSYLSTPFPDVRELEDIIVLAPDLAYAVGTDGTILKMSADKKGVKSWAKEASGTTEDLQAISGFLEDDGTGTNTQKEVLMIVGHNGVVLQRTDPGKWAVLASNVGVELFSVHLIGDKDGFVVGEAGTILRFDGTANTLTAQTAQTQQEVVGTPCPANGNCGSAVCESDNVCHSFFPIPEALKGVGGDQIVFAVGERGAVYSFDATGDPNAKWSKESTNQTRPLASVYTHAGIMMPSTDGVLLTRSDANAYVPPPNGTQFDDADLRTPAPVFLQDVWVDGGDMFAVGLSQEIFHRNGEGIFDLTTVAVDAQMRGIDGTEAPPDDDPKGAPVASFIAVGGGGRIVRGPAVLPLSGETPLATRLSSDDFQPDGQ